MATPTRSGHARAMATAWLALSLLLFPAALGAQSGGGISASVVQGLGFGAVFPGAADHVTIGDAARRGVVVIDGQGTVSVQFNLPQAMQSAEGARLPLRFGATDLGVAQSATEAPVALDPNRPQQVQLRGSSGRTWLYLGGTADASVPPPPGSYSATVVVVISKSNT